MHKKEFGKQPNSFLSPYSCKPCQIVNLCGESIKQEECAFYNLFPKTLYSTPSFTIMI